MGGISYNVWLRGLCAGVSWFCVLCLPTDSPKQLLLVSSDTTDNARYEH
jgi:hypothetical protein